MLDKDTNSTASETPVQEPANGVEAAPAPETLSVEKASCEAASDSTVSLRQPGQTDESSSRSSEESARIIEEIRDMAFAEAQNLDYLPKPVESLKKNSHLFIKMLISLLLIFVVLFFVTARLVFGRGWITNMLDGGGNFQSFTIPVTSHPQADDKYYQPDGRYTVEGVAKLCSPSIVTIEVYIDNTVFGAYGQGSGIIMTEDGYIITNAHVIDDAQLAIIVRLQDGTEYNATVIGSDQASDLAIIKINATGLTPAQFGDSSELELGEQVVALGTPAGLEGTVTTGVVSGLDRMIQSNASTMSISCIQIDAAINPGNSGGALFNMWGQVVGITSSKIESVEYDNIGFAISMEAAKPILEQLIETGSVLGRPKVGISFYEVSDTIANVYGIPAGLHIAEIDQSCDVANTDLQINDVITEMNGIEVRSAEDVYSAIESLSAGDSVTASVLRLNMQGEWEEFEITFKLMPSDSSIQPEENVRPELPDRDGGFGGDDEFGQDGNLGGADDEFGIDPSSDEITTRKAVRI